MSTIEIPIINWTKFKFITRKNEWFIEGSEARLLFPYITQYKLDDIIEENGGLFEGQTNEPLEFYDGLYPRPDEEGCPFNEFDIYYGDEIINDWTYEQLINKMKSCTKQE